jgi:hypothetical protein
MNPVDGGDETFIQVNMVPTSMAGAVAEPEPVRSLPAVETRSMDERMRHRAAFMPLITDAADRIVRGEQRDIKKRLDLLGKDPAAFITWLDGYYRDTQPAFTHSVMGPVFRSFAQAVAGAALAEVDGDSVADVDEFVTDYLNTFANRYALSSRAQLVDVAETDTDDPVAAVETRVDSWSEGTDTRQPRPIAVGKREATQLSDAVAKAVWIGAGVTSLVWRKRGDTCPYCRKLDGKVVGTTVPFVTDDLEVEGESTLTVRNPVGHPPVHQGCDCTISPI